MTSKSRVPMTEHKRIYTPEFKREAVHLVETAGKPATQIARELKISDKTLHGWMADHRKAQGSGTTVDAMKSVQAELVKLKRENQRLKQERDFSYGPYLSRGQKTVLTHFRDPCISCATHFLRVRVGRA